MDDLLVNDGVNEEILIDFDPDSFKEDWQKNSAWSVGFTIPKTVRNAFTYDMIQADKVIIYNGQQFIIKSLNPNAAGPVTYKEVTAPHIYFTCQDHRRYEQQSKVWAIDEAMHWAFDGNVLGFTFEIIGSFPTVQIDNFGDNDALSMLSDILNKFGAILEADNRHLILYSAAEWGSVTEKVIRYQYNTDGVQCTVDTSNLKTVIKGYGKQNDDGSYVFDPVTYTSPNITKYGERHAAPIRDDRFLYADSMTDYLKTQLQDEPVVSLSAPLKVKEEINRGEHRLLIYEPLNLDTDVQIVAYTKYPKSNKPPEVTFSNSTKNIVDVMSSFASVGATIGKVIDDTGQVRTDALSPTIAEAVQKINSVVTGDDLLDLAKSTGKIQENQARIGPGTTFADGYDPSQITPNVPLASETQDGMESKAHFKAINSLPVDSSSGSVKDAWYDGTNQGRGLMPAQFAQDHVRLLDRITFGSDASNNPYMDIKVFLNNQFLAYAQGAQSLEQLIDALTSWVGSLLEDDGSGGERFNPVVDMNATGYALNSLLGVLHDLDSRITGLGG